MPRKFKYCVHCRRTITEQEIARWAFAQTKDGLLCATCAQRMDEEGASGSEAAPEATAAVSSPPEQSPAAPPVQAPPIVEPPAPIVPPPAPPKPPPAPEPAEAPPEPVRAQPPEKAPAAAPAEFTEAAEGPDAEHPADLLESIHRHVSAIHRTLVFEKSSPWTVMATVAQCLAVGLLMIAVFNWANKPEDLLLVAILFQIMALTFFVRGK